MGRAIGRMRTGGVMATLRGLAGAGNQELRRYIAGHRLFAGLIAGHFALTALVAQRVHRQLDLGLFAAMWQLFVLFLPAFLFVVMVWRFGAMAAIHRPKRPIKWLAADLLGLARTPGRVFDGLMSLLLLSVFTACYGYFKALIPDLVPFAWDRDFARLDIAIHGGVLPQEVLLRLFGTPWTIAGLNVVYDGWFLVMFLTVLIALFSTADRVSRQTFLVAFVLAWGLGGNVIATLLSSAGPCYYGLLGLGPLYDHLNTTLAAYGQIAPNWSLDTQKWLWEGYTGQGNIKGISAMPSMHLASTTILTLYAFRRGRWAGRAMCVFMALIAVGAVMLGWHYCVDVYAGILCGLASWWVAARVVNAGMRRTVAPGVVAAE